MTFESMAGRDFGGFYRLEEEIGRGGIGVVYRALNRKLDQPVAVKLLRSEAIGPSQRPRFEREAKALAALSHPNIVAILDCGVSESVPYLVMELLEGQSLAQALGPEPLPLARAETVIRELFAALAYVHGRGLVHRDLKPANVFLQRQKGGGEQVKLLDFGLAKFLDAVDTTTLTRTGEVFGTPSYMPPEQWSGQAVDARADVYSAAVVCFELLAGRKPFPGQGQDLLRQQLVEPAPLLHEVCEGRVGSPGLERLLQRALAQQPGDRQRDATELAAELAALPRPWLYSGAEATPDRRRAVETVRDQLNVAIGPTVEQRAPVAAPTPEPEPARDPAPSAQNQSRSPASARRFVTELLHRVLLASAWTLTVVSSIAIVVAALVIYVMRSPERGAERAALEQALPPLREAAAAAKAVASDTIADATERVSRALPQLPTAGSRAEPALPPAAELARDPWRGSIPAALRKLRTRIDAGQRGDARMLAELRRYNREHGEDPRGHLLLARLFVNRGAWHEVTAQYQLAFARDASSRGDPRMLRDLVRAAAHKASSARASELVQSIFGREALDAVARARERAPAQERARLDRLARALAR